MNEGNLMLDVKINWWSWKISNCFFNTQRGNIFIGVNDAGKVLDLT